MKRDIELERKILLKIEKEYEPGSLTIFGLEVENYPPLVVAEHCRLLHDQGLVNEYKPSVTLSGILDFEVGDMTAKGYDTLELIRNEKAWKKAQKTAEEKEVPQTMENIATIAGVFIGNVIKEMSGIP